MFSKLVATHTLENKKIPNKGKVYLEFKAKYPISILEELETNLSNIKSLVNHYKKRINPRNETDKYIRLKLEYINRSEINFKAGIIATEKLMTINVPYYAQIGYKFAF